jgi:hypothetical protein
VKSNGGGPAATQPHRRRDGRPRDGPGSSRPERRERRGLLDRTASLQAADFAVADAVAVPVLLAEAETEPVTGREHVAEAERPRADAVHR